MVYTYVLNVSYNSNGGSGAPSAQVFQTLSSSTTSITVSGTLSTKKPTRDGYKFLGWTASGVNYNPGDTITKSYVYDGGDQTKSVTLVARWSKIPTPSTFGVCPSSVLLDGSTQYTFNIDKSTSADHHSMKFVFGSKKTNHTNLDSSKTVTFPLNWNNEIPNSTSGLITVTLTTFDANNNQIGDSVSISVTANVPSNIVPTMTISHSRVNENQTVSGWDLLLQGYSKISLSASASGSYGSSIASISFSGPNLQQIGSSASAISDTLTLTGSQTWTVKATDTRGRTVTKTYTETIYEYSKPSIKSASAKRCNQNGTLNETSGLYGKFRAVFAYSDANNRNTTTQKLEYKKHGTSSYTTIANSYTNNSNVIFGNGSLAADDAFDVKLTITDALGNQITKTVLLSSISGFSIGLKNDRARFGGVPLKPGLQIDWDTDIKGDLLVAGSINTIGKRFIVQPDAISIQSGSWTSVSSVQLESGIYVIVFGCSFAQNSTGIRRVNISENQNSSNAQVRGASSSFPAINGAPTYASATTILTISNDTTLYVNAYQSSGSSLSVTPWIRAVKLS